MKKYLCLSLDTDFFIFIFRFVHSLAACLSQVCGYKQLVIEVERLRATAYDADNLLHEQQLLQLWSLLQPGVPLMTRKTKQWQNIGFQGNDPKTDFRGMGLLGLENLFISPLGILRRSIIQQP